ncbi:hypothetical protein B0H19DRAFT_1263614 [Mycena capillaripes]|nr:hypothetical protein B0H19DRAFT_1263614 [Mycena capillaripes]
MSSWSKILGLASVAAATALVCMVAFDVPYFKSAYFLRIDLSSGGESDDPLRRPSALRLALATSYRASKFINGTLPPALAAGVATVASTLTKVLVLHLVTFGIVLVSFAFAVLAFLGAPIADCCSFCFRGFAGSAGFAVFIFDIAFFEIIKLRVNEEGHGGTAIWGTRYTSRSLPGSSSSLHRLCS